MNIYQRINAVMREVKYLKKDQQVSGGGANYKAITRDSVVGALREHIVNAGIVIETSQLSGEWTVLRDMNATPNPIKMGLYKGYYSVSFVNIDDPQDRAVINVEAHATDNGDKAPGKAMTYAEKNGLVKQFLCETGIDDEERPSDYIDESVSDQFIYLIETESALELDEFMSQWSPDDPARRALFDACPKGRKTEYTKKWKALIDQAASLYSDYAVELDDAIDDAINTQGYEELVDSTLIQELWWDNTERYKKRVWGQLNEESKDFLKSGGGK